MLKSIVLIGPPCSGKSTLMRGLRDRLGYRQCVEYGLLAAELYPDDRVLFIGRWVEGDATPGTDRLMPEAAQWLSLLVSHARHLALLDYTIVMDGHHLTTTELVQTLRNHTEHTLIRLVASDVIRAERLEQRHGGPMDPEYATGLSVRYAWLSATYEPDAVWRNETEADYARNLARLCALVGIETEMETT